MLLANFRSLYHKTDILKAIMHTCSAEIIIGTETWLSEDVTSSELSLPSSLVIFRKDRTGSRGGGVVVAINELYHPSPISVDSPLEIVWASCHIGHVACVIGACYRPPDSNSEFPELLGDAIEQVTQKFPNSLLFLGGDFNYPEIDWSTLSALHDNNRSECIRFLQLLLYHNLTQLVHKPTRKDRVLDLVLTNSPEICSTRVLEEISDHRVVHCLVSLPTARKSKIKKQLLNYARTDITKMNSMLHTFAAEFYEYFDDRTTNENWCLFRDKLKEIEATCVPKLTISSRSDDPWFTRDVKRALNKKKRVYRKASRSNCPQDWEAYENISAETHSIIFQAKDKFFNETLPNLMKTDPKKFWNIVNPKSTHSTAVLMREDGSTLSVEHSAEKFNKHFTTVFTDELPLNDSLSLSQLPIEYPFPAILITEHGVANAISRLPLKTSPGPDGISAKLLKLTCQHSAKLLAFIFQQSLDSGCIPDDWKLANVVPIFKSGNSNHPNNYRPISLTSISCKLLEHIIHSQVMRHLNRNNLLLQTQHGFREKLSCQTQLFELVTDLHTALHMSICIDALFIDFSKAFDRVPHNRLMLKIRHLSLDQKTTAWIQEFLNNRSQSVKLNNYISHPTRVTSGVPQGSVLGPLLFLVYINDIASNISSSIRLFADDCVVYRKITCTDDVAELQQDLTRLGEWCSKWQMEINVEKTKHLMFTNITSACYSSYKINDSIIEKVTSFKYLGVILTSDLSWTAHIEYTTNKALKKLGLLKRRLHFTNKDTRLRAFNSLIRPSLEYASIIWHPHQIGLTNMLEMVQNKAARFISSSYSRYISVSLLKSDLGLTTLAMRRRLTRLSFFHSLYHSNSSFAQSHIFPAPHTSSRLDHAHKVAPIFARTKKFQNSPLSLCIIEWNSLPPNIAEITDPSIFNSMLQGYLHSEKHG